MQPSIKLLTSRLIFIGGVTKSGKSFLGTIVSSFKKFEMFFTSPIAENISYINKFKGINSNYSVFLFKLIFNEIIYNLNIGRNLNHRKKDATSIFNFKNPKMYFDRLNIDDGDEIIKKIKKEKHNYPVMFHDPLINPELILNSFPKAKIIFIDRHPAEIIDLWIKKKYYKDFSNNPRNMTLWIKYKNQNFPFWCKKNLKKIYNSKNIYTKLTYTLSELIFMQKKNLEKLDKKFKQKILLVNFDNLVQNTDVEIKKIIKFLKCRISKKTYEIILNQKGNRTINFKNRNKSKKIILDNLDKEATKIFKKLEKNYYEVQ
jgi:hypothetical protein